MKIGRLDLRQQQDLLADIVETLADAPFFQPTLPRWGTPFSVRMSNCGPWGWVSDKSGYRYQTHHPETGNPWPPMPESLLQLWQKFASYAYSPEAALINHYSDKAKMGLHQDKDEQDYQAPVLSVSLGDTARFRLGGDTRKSATTAFDLVSGDVMILSGATRLAFHGIDRLYPQTSDLLNLWPQHFPQGGRINITLRRVTNPVTPL